jgi:hypothetical protein
VKNGPEPAEHGLQLGGCLSCRDAPPAGLRPTFTFAPLPRGDGTAFRRGLRRELRRVLRRGSIVNTHSRGLHREHARPGQPIFLFGRRRHGASTFFLGVAGMARPLSLSLAGRARNTDGTHPRASSGARSAVSGPFPEVLLPAWRRASSACDRQDPTEQSRSRPRRRWGRRHATPRNLGRAGRAFVGLRYRWGIH